VSKPTRRQVRVALGAAGLLVAVIAVAKAAADLRQRMADAEAEAAA
jgi:hypothetical protein